MAFQKNKKWFVYNRLGQSIWINRKTVKWKKTDNFCFLIQIQNSFLPSLQVGTVCWVFDDQKNDERYILDSQGRKVLYHL